MKIRQFSTQNIFESLRTGEYYIWTVHYDDGTSQKFKIRNAETGTESLQRRAKKPIVSIDHSFDIHSDRSHELSADSAHDHRQQDSTEQHSDKSDWHTFKEEATLNELSVKTLKSYKEKVPDVDPMADKYKAVKHAEGYGKASRQIAHKTGDRSSKAYESRLQEFVDMAYEANGFADILNKQAAEKQPETKKKVVDIDFHGWTVRYRPASKTGESVPWHVMDRKGDIKQKGDAPTDKDAVAEAEDWIKQGGHTSSQASNNVTVDFNVAFAREFAPTGETFYATIDQDGNMPVLILSYELQQGFKTSHPKPGQAGAQTITLSAKECNTAKLQPNGRYMLGDKDQIDDNTAMFPLIFQSITQSSTDKLRMAKPGITVASSRT